jgi:hypothetical protein
MSTTTARQTCSTARRKLVQSYVAAPTCTLSHDKAVPLPVPRSAGCGGVVVAFTQRLAGDEATDARWDHCCISRTCDSTMTVTPITQLSLHHNYYIGSYYNLCSYWQLLQ